MRGMIGAPPLVAHVIYRLDVGGLENGLVNLVNRMPPERYRHVILCLSGFGAEFSSRIERPDVEVVSLDKRPGKDVGAYWRMWRALRRLRPAIVHTRNLGTVDMQWIAAIAGVRRRVHGEHGWEASDPAGLNVKGLRIRRACRPLIHRFVPMSRDIAGWLERSVGIEPSRIRQIYSGVDAARFHPGISIADRLTVGTVGRLDPVKNQVALLHAVRKILARLPELTGNLRLVIVGDGPLRESLEATARELGIASRVEFTGARSDIARVLQGFDVFVLPSINEGISNTILEAMASGLPVVAARVGGNPELVEDAVTGSLYAPGDLQGLVQAVLPYLTDPGLRRAHGEAGRARVVQNFSLDAMVTRYLSLYDELMSTA